VAELRALYSSRGTTTYFGESVTTLEHSLQTAYLASEAKAPTALIVAALLHDIGHLVDAACGNIGDWNSDARHACTCRRNATCVQPILLT
jgi:predicted HD phosphohydrolase